MSQVLTLAETNQFSVLGSIETIIKITGAEQSSARFLFLCIQIM